MTTAKPSDLPHQRLSGVKQLDPLTVSMQEVDAVMSDYLGEKWRDVILPAEAIQLTHITLDNVQED